MVDRPCQGLPRVYFLNSAPKTNLKMTHMVTEIIREKRRVTITVCGIAISTVSSKVARTMRAFLRPEQCPSVKGAYRHHRRGNRILKQLLRGIYRACPDLANSAFLSLAVLPCYSEAEVRPHLVTGNLLTVSFFFLLSTGYTHIFPLQAQVQRKGWGG